MRSRAFAFALGLGLALGLAELAVRIADPPPRPLRSLALGSYRLSQNPVLRYEYRPNLRSTDTVFNAGHRGLETNSAGFRDDETPLAKPPGTVRIAILGDSITAGINNPRREDIFPDRLESLLNRSGGPARYEVLNFGVGGYHTLQEVELLRARGLAYDPDVVLLAFCVNDFHIGSDGGVFRRLREADPEYAPSAGGRSLRGWILERSRLAFFVHHRLRGYEDDDDREREYVERHLGERSSVEVGFEMLAELQEEHGFRALVFIVPSFRTPFDAYAQQEIHDRVFDTAARFPGLEVIDLKQDLRRANPDARTFSGDGIHPNVAGHTALAGILYAKLRERGVGVRGNGIGASSLR